jgi:hypothetical protein
MAACGISDSMPHLDTSLNQAQQFLVDSAIAIFFEHAAQRLFSYLSHHPTGSFSNETFVRVLKSTVLDDSSNADLQLLFESACEDNIVLDEILIDGAVIDKVKDCIQLAQWMKNVFPFEIDVLQWTLTRGLLLGCNPDIAIEELQDKFLRVYGDCDSCGLGPFEDCECAMPDPIEESPKDYDDGIDCNPNNRCENCTKVDNVNERYNPETMKSTPIGDILNRSIERQETFED